MTNKAISYLEKKESNPRFDDSWAEWSIEEVPTKEEDEACTKTTTSTSFERGINFPPSDTHEGEGIDNLKIYRVENVREKTINNIITYLYYIMLTIIYSKHEY